VAELLKDKPVGHHAFQKLRKMKPIRQLEVAELMVSANNYGANYAKALLATTNPGDLHRPDELKKATGLSPQAPVSWHSRRNSDQPGMMGRSIANCARLLRSSRFHSATNPARISMFRPDGAGGCASWVAST